MAGECLSNLVVVLPGGEAVVVEGADPSSQSLQLHGCLDRLRAGDRAARDELFRHLSGRLERLTRKLLKGFPGVRRWAGTDDVLQNAALRLLRALEEVRPGSVREFLALGAQQIRRELIDMARHYYGPLGLGANHASRPDGSSAPPEPADASHEPAALLSWCEFHQRIQALPPGERELVDLLYYQGLPQAEAAAVLQVAVRTVQRRWQAVLLKLHELLKDQWPGD
jgi:RNA polymerase sigma-70 factor (ECF subfamily)